MPSPTITSNYAGITQGEILQRVILGNEAFEKKSFMFQEDIDDKGMELSRLTVADNIIQPYQSMPSTPSEASIFTPRRLDPVECLIYDRFNPKEFRSYWREYQDGSKLDDKIIKPEIQAAILLNYRKKTNNQIGRLVWQGDTSLAANSPLRFINGIVTRASADAAVPKPAAASNITPANVQTRLAEVDALILDDLYDDPDMVFHMSTKTFRDYQTSVINLANKGQGPAEKVPALYRGREIRFYSGFPQHFILAAKATNSPASNLHAGMNMADEESDIRMERWRPEGDIYFLKASFSLDVNYAFGEEMVLYKPV